MKKLQVASLLLFAFVSGAAQAADMTMPMKAAPPPVRPVGWTGCYGAVGFGYGMYDVPQYGESFPGLIPATQNYDDGGRGWSTGR